MGNHMRLIDADALAKFIDYGHLNNPDEKLYSENDIREMIEMMPTIERDVPKRVLWTGWKGHRDTRYKCPTCNKPVRNDDDYCHRCGQRLMFPKISFTPYVEGQKQELIVRWEDETD